MRWWDMAPFWTDAPIEDWPTTETRLIEIPDGTQRPVTATWLVWEYYDWITRTEVVTPERLVTLAIRDAEEMNRAFEESFAAGCIAWAQMRIQVLGMFKPHVEARKAELLRQLRELSARPD